LGIVASRSYDVTIPSYLIEKYPINYYSSS